jgi:hypothetical protein
MKTIEVFGQVDEHHRLSATVPTEVPPGPVRLALTVPSPAPTPTNEDDADPQWALGVAREWREDLADTRQDIYTLADGDPVDEAR